MDDSSELNPEQLTAVRAKGSAVLVLAGPGSGKTRVITNRVAWLLKSTKCNPHGIVLVTFTNKAANEMRDRVRGLVGPSQASRLQMGTFHSLANRALRVHGEKVGLPSNFTIMDAQDGQSLVKKLIRQSKQAEKYCGLSPRVVLGWISWAKTTRKSSDELRKVVERKDATHTASDIAKARCKLAKYSAAH